MKVQVLKDQIILANQKTNILLKSIPIAKWMDTPEVLSSNLNWQIGHVILANYLHGIASITGPSSDFKEMVDVPNFVRYYGPKSVPTQFDADKPSAEDLLAIYEFTYNTIIKGLESISDDELIQDTTAPNPAVKTKYEALLWVSQHQSWHNGQIAILKRVLG
jgi:hypothetical protein